MANQELTIPQPASYYEMQSQKEKSKRASAGRRLKREELKYSTAITNKELKSRSYDYGTRRLEATSGAVRTGVSLFNFLKPVIVFMLMVVLVFGVGWRALESIVVGVGWWWLAIIVLVLLFYKYR